MINEENKQCLTLSWFRSSLVFYSLHEYQVWILYVLYFIVVKWRLTIVSQTSLFNVWILDYALAHWGVETVKHYWKSLSHYNSLRDPALGARLGSFRGPSPLCHELLFLPFCFLTTAQDNAHRACCGRGVRAPLCLHICQYTLWPKERLLFNLWSRARKNCALWRLHNVQSAKGSG